jgi:Arc/MetJ family transcription regulator
MTQVNVDDALVQEAVKRYPRHSPEEIVAEALRNYLACAQLLDMNDILKDADLWDDTLDA